MKYKYHWTLWLPVFGIIRFFYIGLKYKFSTESFPVNIHPVAFPLIHFSMYMVFLFLYVIIKYGVL